MNFFRLPVIVGALPNVLANGQTADATPLMADLNWIVNQVNANAAPLANVALTNANNSFTQPQGGVSAQTVSQFVIAGDIITGGYQTLTSALGTNAITARSTQIIPSSLVANQAVFLIPSQTNTGPVSLNRDNLGSFAVLNMGSGCRGGELQAGIPARLFLDGSNYHFINQNGFFPSGVTTPEIGTNTLKDFKFKMNGVDVWAINNGTPNQFLPLLDNNTDVGGVGLRLRSVLTTSINSVGSALTLTQGQLLFPAVQNPSNDPNCQDDYEEGLWTPVVGGTATYTTQTGTYTKIGRLVFINGTLTINAIGSGSTTTISGLPFTANATAANPIAVSDTGSLASSIVSITGRISVGGTSIVFLSRTAANVADSSNAIFQNAATITFAGCYQTT